MRIIFQIYMLLFFCNFVNAQSYNTIAGLKFGDDMKFSIVQRVANKLTIEGNFSDGLLSSHNYFSCALRNHESVLTKRINVFYGGGYFFKSYNGLSTDKDYVNPNNGFIATLGGEFSVNRLNFSIDFSPHLALNKSYTGKKFTTDSSISVRYVFWKRESSMRKFFKKIF